jgi:hypothetical protein
MRRRKNEKDWNPTREERESPSPKSEDEYLAPTKTQDRRPTGEKGETPVPTNNEMEQRTTRWSY